MVWLLNVQYIQIESSVYNDVFRNLLGYGKRDIPSFMFAMNAIDSYEALMCKTYFTFR